MRMMKCFLPVVLSAVAVSAAAAVPSLITVVEKHRAAFGGGWESAGRQASRFFSSFFARFQLLSALSDSGRKVPAHPLAFRRFCGLRGFAPLAFHCR